MGSTTSLGEFEQVVLLSVLQAGSRAVGPEVARVLEEVTEREVSRGALYSALDRLERKGLVTWTPGTAAGEHRGRPLRVFTVTDAGRAALQRQRAALMRLWRGLGPELKPRT